MENESNLMGRREWCAAGLSAAALGVAAPGARAADDAEPTLKSRFLFEMEAELEPPQDIGDRQIYIAKSGVVRGPRINGTLLPGGGDWFRTRSDGVSILDVRATIETDDGALIYVTYNGMVHGSYFRVVPWFQTASDKYAWLNKLVSVGVNKPAGAGQVSYDVYAIL